MTEIGNGNKIINSQIITGDKKIIINGKEIPEPPVKTNNVTIINDNVFIGGYEYKNREWKRTYKALFHKYF